MSRRLGAALLAVAACSAPLSQQPLSPAESAVLDPALIGTWAASDGDETMVVHVTQRAGGVMTVVVRAQGQPLELRAHVTTLGKARYLNAQIIEPAGTTGWLIARYALDKRGVLTVSGLTQASARAAIAAGKVKGRLDEARGEVVINEPAGRLAAFVQGAGYEPLATLVRRAVQ